MAQFFKQGRLTVNLDGLRCIEEIHSNPCGGPPYSDGGVLHYDNGEKINVGLDFAVALAASLRPTPTTS